MTNETTKQNDHAGNGKLTYSPPRLLHHGSLTDLTQAGEFFGNDGNTQCTGNADAAQQPCVS